MIGEIKRHAWVSILAILGIFAPIPLTAQDGEEATAKEVAVEKRTEFLQANFARFVPVEFKKGAGADAKIQILKVKENTFDYDGAHFCGFKFTVPQWIDGDFRWTHFLAKTGANKDFFSDTSWFIIPEKGRAPGFRSFYRSSVTDHPVIKERFPHTRNLWIQSLEMDRLEPRKTYAIWFRFVEANMPDIAFAISIHSERGIKEFGALPLGPRNQLMDSGASE